MPKRTWNGDEANVPSSCCTMITSMAPVSVAALMPLYSSRKLLMNLPTYSMAST